MARVSILTDEADAALDIMAKVSQGVRKLLRDVMARIENSPSSFPILDFIPEPLVNHPSIRLRKAKVTHQRHDFRILFFHWTDADGEERADIFLVFPRQDDYQIDWQWVEEAVRDLSPEDPG